MSKFVKVVRQDIVDAFQWTPAEAKEHDPVALEQEPHPTKPGEFIVFGSITTKNRGQLRVNPGDFVLVLPRDEQGQPDYDVVTEHEFRANYLPSEAPKADEPKKAK